MGIALDRDVETVLAFMERNIEMNKLGRVAAKVADLAPVLWTDQEPLREPLINFTHESRHEQLATAIQSPLARACAGDGFVVAEGGQ